LPLVSIHPSKHCVDHLCDGSLGNIFILLVSGRHIDRVLSAHSIQQSQLFGFRIDSDHDIEQQVDHTQLHLLVCLKRTLIDRVDDRVDQKSGVAPVLSWRFTLFQVDTVV